MPKDKIVVNVKIGEAPSAAACKVLDHTCLTSSENWPVASQIVAGDLIAGKDIGRINCLYYNLKEGE
jgi:hypothetical protein